MGEGLLVAVCTANMCRSPVAHAILAAEVEWRGLRCTVQSAGVLNMNGARASIEAQRVCERWNTPMPKVEFPYTTELDLSDVTRIFVMQSTHLDRVLALTRAPQERVQLLSDFDPYRGPPDIEDPIGLPPHAYQECYRRIRDCLGRYLDTTEELNAHAPPIEPPER